jgi:hypothetical protein
VISTSSISPVELKSRGVISLCAGGCLGGGRSGLVRSDGRGARYNVAVPLSVGNDIYVGGSCRGPCAILGYCSLDRERRAQGTRCFFESLFDLFFRRRRSGFLALLSIAVMARKSINSSAKSLNRFKLSRSEWFTTATCENSMRT